MDESRQNEETQINPGSNSAQMIENPVTGERVTFTKRSEDTNGERVEFEIVAEPHATGPPEQVHENQEEYFEILSGRVSGTLDGTPFSVEAGESFVITAGTPHRWWNEGNDEQHPRVVVEPALEFTESLETLYGLAADGKTNSKGIPNPLQKAVIAYHYWETNHLASPP